jgi:mRNA interferase YafQ
MTPDEFFETLENFTDTVCIIDIEKSFKKQVDLAFKRGLDLSALLEVVHTLAKGEALSINHRPHPLKGKWEGVWDCHVKADWVLLYNYSGDKVILSLLTD